MLIYYAPLGRKQALPIFVVAILNSMGGSISQMQLLYSPEEDRIFFRVNSTDRKEFRFWITRRYAMLLMKILKEHRVSDPDVVTQSTAEAKQAIQSFKQEKAIDEADFTRKFDDNSNELPLGEQAQVAFKLNYGIKEGILRLGIQPKEGQGISIVLNQDLNVSFSQLLRAAADKGAWKISDHEASAVGATDRRVIN